LGNNNIDTDLQSPTSISFPLKISNVFSSKFYSAITTNTISCNGVDQFDSKVCSENGNCINSVCSCNFGYFGDNCELTSCNGVLFTNNSGCSGNGKCLGYDQCKCNFGYSNLNCSSFSCNGVDSNDQNVCFGKGTCLGYNNCTCSSPFFIGSNCDNPSNIAALVTPLISVCVFCLLISLCVTLIFFIIIILFAFYQKKKKTFIIKNKELTDKLLMMNDLNKINFSSLKFDKKNGNPVILGKGASSIVYSGKYNSKRIAIKEIKSEEFEENLITEIVLLKNIDHNNIIKYYGYSIDQLGNFYIITGKKNLKIKKRINE
jgi:hypothetical protein